MAAETPLGRAFLAVDHRVPFADRAAALDLQRLKIAHDVDRITAATGALAADRAVAALVGVGGLAGERKLARAAAAVALERYRHGATPRSAAFSGRCAGGRADNQAGRIRGSRISHRNLAPGTRRG